MCTYSRKKNENLIEGVENFCRLCLGDLEDPVRVFYEGDNKYTTLSFRIMLCAGIELSYEANLSNSICKHCYEQVEKYYVFRKKCQSSYCKLKSHLEALKNKMCVELKQEKHEMLNLDENSDEEQLVVNFEKDQKLELTYDLNTDCTNEVCVENNLEESMNNELVLEENNETTQDITEEQSIQTEVNTELSTIPCIEEERMGSHLEISTFLSSILTEFGVIQRHGDCLELIHHGVNLLELEMNDDNLITLEIVEEDAEFSQALVTNDTVAEDVVEGDAREDIVIRFMAGSNKPSRTDVDEASGGNLEGKQDTDDEDDPKPEFIERDKAICGECCKEFASKSSLRRHLRVHSGERPHACKICNKRFSQLAILNRHRLTHLETRPFKCESCEKSFTQRSGLVAHTRAHQPPHKRPLQLHKCPQCTKVFLYPSGLSRHMTTHNGRVYVCIACEKQFSDKSSLLRHLKCCKRKPRRDPDERSPQIT